MPANAPARVPKRGRAPIEFRGRAKLRIRKLQVGPLAKCNLRGDLRKALQPGKTQVSWQETTSARRTRVSTPRSRRSHSHRRNRGALLRLCGSVNHFGNSMATAASAGGGPRSPDRRGAGPAADLPPDQRCPRSRSKGDVPEAPGGLATGPRLSRGRGRRGPGKWPPRRRGRARGPGRRNRRGSASLPPRAGRVP